MNFAKIMVGLVLLCSFLCSRESHADKPEQKIELLANLLNGKPDEVILELTLKNAGRAPLKIYSASLPWIAQISINLLAFTDDRYYRPLHRGYYIDDPDAGAETTIAPGESRTGVIDLGRQFRGLAASLQRQPVVVFLDYEPMNLNGQPAPRILKGIVIPKRSKVR